MKRDIGREGREIGRIMAQGRKTRDVLSGRMINLAETFELFQVANAQADLMLKAALFSRFPVIAMLDFREVIVRAFGEEDADLIEARLRRSMGLGPKEE